MSKKLFAVTIVSILVMVLAGCSPRKLVLKKIGPTETSAGEVFNKQSNGESALWSETENATPTTVLVLNGVSLDSALQKKDGTVVTAFVPKKLYEKVGIYSVYLLDTKTNKKSNELKFVVRRNYDDE